MSDKIDVLVIGAGSIGERHIRCFQNTHRVNVSVCETNADVRQRVVSEYGLSHAFSDFDEAVAHGFQAAVVCTPAQLHVPMATRLAEAGMHVLIEKPLSTSLDGLDGLKKEVTARGLVAVVAYVYRSNPVLASMRAALADGRFGKPLQLIYTGGQNFGFYRPAYREIYFNDHRTGGGAIQDGLTHVVNAGEWLVGPVTRLAADAEHKLLEGVDVEDTVNVIARHGDVLASYAMNLHQAHNELTVTVICERGTARFEAHEQRWRWKMDPESDWHNEASEPIERDTTFVIQADAFLDTIAGTAEPLCTLDEGIQTLRVNLAILRAAETGRWQTV